MLGERSHFWHCGICLLIFLPWLDDKAISSLFIHESQWVSWSFCICMFFYDDYSMIHSTNGFLMALTFRLNHFEAWFSPGEPHGYGTCGGRPTDLSAEGCTLGGGRLGKGCFGVATSFVFRCFALCSNQHTLFLFSITFKIWKQEVLGMTWQFCFLGYVRL